MSGPAFSRVRAAAAISARGRGAGLRGCVAAVLLAAMAGGCAPAVELAEADTVRVGYYNYAESPDSVRPLADAECAKSDRIARHVETTVDEEDVLDYLLYAPQHALFRCVAKGPVGMGTPGS